MFINSLQNKFNKMKESCDYIKKTNRKFLTLTEKILFTHMDYKNNIERGSSYIELYPDRVAMQDATAQMAALQFMNAGKEKVQVPSSIHCDHLIMAEKGVEKDLYLAKKNNNEIYTFLKNVSNKYGMDFWEPGSGIIHQVILEQYAYPGQLLIGTDSHTPNAGGMGMLAIGVGGTDAVDVMAGLPLILKMPKIIGINLTGILNSWVSPKDIILKVMDILTVKGGTGCIIEFFGDGCNNISATGRATITNMGAEHGATTSIFPTDKQTIKYLLNTNRKEIADIIVQNKSLLTADDDVLSNPELYYDKVININLNELHPCIAGPHSPDLITKISDFKKFIKENNYPEKLSAALIGSCTNSSYEDFKKIIFLAEFAVKNNIKCKIPLYITPGSNTISKFIKNKKNYKLLEKIGATILSNACGPCIGQWQRGEQSGEKNSIISSYNRNFPARNDGNRNTLSFIASPEIVMATALAGNITFNPLEDKINIKNNINISLPLNISYELLYNEEFKVDKVGLIKSGQGNNLNKIYVNNNSNRLKLLTRFDKFNKLNYENMRILIKTEGKCTTDHISPAGKWLKFRGHLENISQNTYSGAKNFFTQEIGTSLNVLNEMKKSSTYDVAMYYKKQNVNWVVIGDENFGEGSSREHAAMQPRYLGCRVIITRSFARIHENNLKKHGILALTFNNKLDYNKISKNHIINIQNLNNIKVGSMVTVFIKDINTNIVEKINCNHTYSTDQIEWFKYGSALNYLSR